MDRPIRPMRASALAFASATVFACSAAAAVVVPGPPGPDFKPVADRVHALTVLVRARAFIADRSDDGRLQVHEAASSASGVLVGHGLAITDLGAVTLPRRDGQLERAAEIEVVVADVGTIPARLVGVDAALGVAVLRLPDETRTLPGASLTAGHPAAAEPMIAFGADDRHLTAIRVQVNDVVDGEGDAFRLQTDRAFPEPFWGGPLFDAQGRLAGLIVRPQGTGGTAIPASLLRPLVEKIVGAGGI